MWCFEMILCHMATCQQIFPYLVLQWHLGIYWITTKTLLAFTINSYFWLSEYWFKVDILSFYRFDAKPNQNLIAIRREPLVQLNKDSRNVAVPASTYGENGMIENVPKKLANGVIASENEVIRSRLRKRVRLVILPFVSFASSASIQLICLLDAKTMLLGWTTSTIGKSCQIKPHVKSNSHGRRSRRSKGNKRVNS